MDNGRHLFLNRLAQKVFPQWKQTEEAVWIRKNTRIELIEQSYSTRMITRMKD